MNRTSKTRDQQRQLLADGGGGLVMLDIRDDVDFLAGAPTQGDLRAWVDACLTIGTDAVILVGEADYVPPGHAWARRRHARRDGDNTIIDITQPTPLGPLMGQEVASPGQKPARTKMYMESESDYDAFIALMAAWRDSHRDITANFQRMRTAIGDDGLLMVFVAQPMEMYYFILQHDMVMHYMDWPDTYGRAMAEVEKTAHCVIDCAAAAGADMIMFGGAGTEIFNPEMIEHHIIAPSRRYIDHCRSRDLFSLMHCCGRTNILLDRQWFDQLRPTVFESFTEAPLGDIASPAAAVKQLPDDIFFKGGLSLDTLRRGTPRDVERAVRQAYADFGDHRFVLAGTCAILNGTPKENLLAATATAREFS
jgi:uroporphyrinogen-III decarboxylase